MDDMDVRSILEEMYLTGSEVFDGRVKEFDTRKFTYKYQVLDLKTASLKSNRENGAKGETDRSEFLKDIEINIYPDTLTWNHDYSYSFNDPYAKKYFWHPAFDDYPVVGVNWKQATAFAHWRSKMMNSFLREIKQPILPEFRLPTESEWEYASRGGLDASPYPWGGPYTRNIKGCFLANFKPLRGNYVADGGIKAIKTASYNPNGYGLYDMSGNVAEWTSNAYDESAFSYSHDMNMDRSYDAQEDDLAVLKRKAIRGGSWKDIAYFIQNSTRTFEYQDTAKSYIGFRCAVDFLGRDKKDFE
jgi:gliding motility-associated lipoprotein GldK